MNNLIKAYKESEELFKENIVLVNDESIDWGDITSHNRNSHIAVLRALILELEGRKMYPAKPCPECGRKLEQRSWNSGFVSYGCYHKDCPAVIRNNYFNTACTEKNDAYNDALQDSITTIKHTIEFLEKS